MACSWAPKKAAANFSKHKVSFELAVRVFDDPHQLSRLDPDPDDVRWRTIGRRLTSSFVVLLAAHTESVDQEQGGRMISARKATSHERRA